VHLLVPSGYPGDGFTVEIASALKRRFGIDHATIQIETSVETICNVETVCLFEPAAVGRATSLAPA
jgi:cobalt-zinc-cadmium efflux system protein